MWGYSNSVKTDDWVEGRALVNVPHWLIKSPIIRFHKTHKKGLTTMPTAGKTCTYSQSTTRYRYVGSHILLVYYAHRFVRASKKTWSCLFHRKKWEHTAFIGIVLPVFSTGTTSAFPPLQHLQLRVCYPETSSFALLSHMVWHWSQITVSVNG